MKDKPTKSRKFKYYVSASFKEPDGTTHRFRTQLYQMGVYCIFDDDPAQQVAYQTPAPLVKLCREIQRDADAGKITDLVWGGEITAQEVNGFWKEVQP